MSRTIRIAAALAAIALAPAALRADPVEEKKLASGKETIDPASGYMFIQSPFRTQGMFLRVPDDSTREAYMKDWEEGFEKARKKHQSALKNWETQVSIAKQTQSAPPEKPVEPTRETFSIGPIELRDTVSYGPMFVFNKSETQFNYLTKVKPGTYIYYGPLYFVEGYPPAGACYCMGTVRFEVKAGVITDLGNFLTAGPKPAPPYDVGMQMVMKMNEERAAKGKDPILPIPKEVSYGLPDSLKGNVNIPRL